MKILPLIAATLLTALPAGAAVNAYEKFSAHLPTNTPVFWNAPTNTLPKSFWIYHMTGPHLFPASVISNAIVLAGYQERGIPPSSTNDTCIFEDLDCNCSCTLFCNFSIRPGEATLYFGAPRQNDWTVQIPDDTTIIRRAWQYARQFQVDPAQVTLKDLTSHFNLDTNDVELTNQICGRGVYLARQFAGVPFISTGNDGFMPEGFYIKFGSGGMVRNFSLEWHDVVPYQLEPAVGPAQIIACLRAHKLIVLPEGSDGTNYLARVKKLTDAKTFTITQVTPYYGQGWPGVEIDPPEPSKFIAPIVELTAVAGFGNSNLTVHLHSPIVPSEVKALLAYNPSSGKNPGASQRH